MISHRPRERVRNAPAFLTSCPGYGGVELSLTQEQKQGAVKTFFTKVKVELDVIPAQALVIEYWLEKAVFDTDTEQPIIAAQRPAHPLGKCSASVQLLAYILVSKYADALPLYRLEHILKRYGGAITRTTMANWIIRLDDVFRPLIKLMREHQLCGDYLQADVAIGKIRKLYVIEDKIKDFDDEQKAQKRQQLSRPLLVELKAWLEKNISRVPRDSLTHKAISYTLNQWDYLSGYCEDGKLQISNALAENVIRPFAVGRRNWWFSDTPRGARASATCYSLISTAKANGLEPYAYIRYVLEHIASAKTVEDIEALLPWTVSL